LFHASLCGGLGNDFYRLLRFSLTICVAEMEKQNVTPTSFCAVRIFALLMLYCSSYFLKTVVGFTNRNSSDSMRLPCTSSDFQSGSIWFASRGMICIFVY
jgi:hypothetical protein